MENDENGLDRYHLYDRCSFRDPHIRSHWNGNTNRIVTTATVTNLTRTVDQRHSQFGKTEIVSWDLRQEGMTEVAGHPNRRLVVASDSGQFMQPGEEAFGGAG